MLREMKNLINSLPDGLTLTTNGKEIDAVKIVIRRSSIWVDFVIGNFDIDSLGHDGCEGCRHEFGNPDLNEEPCLSCRQNHMDNYVPETKKS